MFKIAVRRYPLASVRSRMQRPPCRVVLCLGLMSLLATGAEAAIFRVGPSSDPACDFNNVALALLATALNEGSDAIHISRNYTHNGSIIPISNQSVTLIGSYADCADTPSSSNAVLDGAGNSAGPTLRVSCTSGSCHVGLNNLSIEGGEDSNLDISGAAVVFVSDTLVGFSSSPGNGGAVRIDGTQGAHLVVTGFSVIGNATAGGNGGGIFCTGRATSAQPAKSMRSPKGEIIEIEYEIEFVDGVLANGVAANGGGAYLTGNCRMRMTVGEGFSGVQGNQATGQGGGIAVMNGAGLYLYGNRDIPATVRDNLALDGGGLIVDGAGSRAELRNTQIIYNKATDHGAGLMVDNGANVLMTSAAPLCRYAHCSSLSNNMERDGFLRGGGASVRRHARFVLLGTHVLANVANYSSAIEVNGFEPGSSILPEVFIGASIIADNRGAIYAVDASRSTVRIDGSTFTGNRDGDAGQSLQAVLYTSNNTYPGFPSEGYLTVTRSVFDNAEGVFAQSAAGDNAGLFYSACIIANAEGISAPLPPDGVLASGTLVAPQSGDWRPRPGSVAIDRCGATDITVFENDIQLNARGVDDPEVIDAAGPYDAGAIERGNPPMFANGFEQF